MNREDKQIRKLNDRSSDRNWTFSEMSALLERFGFVLARTSGSHHHFINMEEKKRFTIALHGRTLRPETIKEVRRWLKER